MATRRKKRLNELPEDVLVRIFSLVPGGPRVVIRLASVCRSFASALRSGPACGWMASEIGRPDLEPWDTLHHHHADDKDSSNNNASSTQSRSAPFGRLVATAAVARTWRGGAVSTPSFEALGDVLWAIDANLGPGPPSASGVGLPGIIMVAGEEGFLRGFVEAQRTVPCPGAANRAVGGAAATVSATSAAAAMRAFSGSGSESRADDGSPPPLPQGSVGALFELRAHHATIYAVSACPLLPNAHTGERVAFPSRETQALVATASADGTAALFSLVPHAASLDEDDDDDDDGGGGGGVVDDEGESEKGGGAGKSIGQQAPSLTRLATLRGARAAPVPMHAVHAAVLPDGTLVAVTCDRGGLVAHWIVSGGAEETSIDKGGGFCKRGSSSSSSSSSSTTTTQDAHVVPGESPVSSCAEVKFVTVCPEGGIALGRPAWVHGSIFAGKESGAARRLVIPVAGVGGVRFVDMATGETLALHPMGGASERFAEFRDTAELARGTVTTHVDVVVSSYSVGVQQQDGGGDGGGGGGGGGLDDLDPHLDDGPGFDRIEIVRFTRDRKHQGGEMIARLAMDTLHEKVLSMHTVAPFVLLALDHAVLVVHAETGESHVVPFGEITVVVTPLSATRFAAVTFCAEVLLVTGKMGRPRTRPLF